MTDKIPQHGHCQQCGKAYIGDDRFCSDECRGKGTTNIKKRKRQLLLLYAITFAVLIVALFLI